MAGRARCKVHRGETRRYRLGLQIGLFSSFLQGCNANDGCLIGGVCEPVGAREDEKGVRIWDVYAILCEKFVGAQVSKAVVCCNFCGKGEVSGQIDWTEAWITTHSCLILKGDSFAGIGVASCWVIRILSTKEYTCVNKIQDQRNIASLLWKSLGSSDYEGWTKIKQTLLPLVGFSMT